MKQVQIFKDNILFDLEKNVNRFAAVHNVVDIKFQTVVDRRNIMHYSVMIIYEE